MILFRSKKELISKKEKILFIFHDKNLTGSSLSLLEILKALKLSKEYDINIHVAHSNGSFIDKLNDLGLSLYCFNKSNSSNKLVKCMQLLIYYLKIFALYLKLKPTLVYSNTIFNFEQVILARVLFIPVIVHVHEGKDILNRFSMRIKLIAKLKLTYLFPSKYSLDSFSKIENNKNKKFIIRNGIEIKDKIVPKTYKKTINLSIIATVDRNKSQLDGIKSLKYLLEHYTNYSFTLNLFGKIIDEKYYEELVDFIYKHQLSRKIIFRGEIANQEIMYSETDILLVTSKDESFGLTIIESFAQGIPVVSSDNMGAKEIIKDNQLCLLYKYGSYEELAECIMYLINNENIKIKIIHNAYKEAFEKYNRVTISHDIEAIIKEKLRALRK